MEIGRFKKLGVNKQTFIVDRDFGRYLKTTISNTKRLYENIPETTEDIYWLFIYELPKNIEEFTGRSMNALLKFLSTKAKFFTHNHCRYLIGKHFMVLNNFVPLDESYMGAEFDENSMILSDSALEEKPLVDITIFSKKELAVYKRFFIDGKSLTFVQKDLKISRYKALKAIEQIRNKLQAESE